MAKVIFEFLIVCLWGILLKLCIENVLFRNYNNLSHFNFDNIHVLFGEIIFDFFYLKSWLCKGKGDLQ